MGGADIIYPPTPTHDLRGEGAATTTTTTAAAASATASAAASSVPIVVTPLTKLGFRDDIISPSEIHNSKLCHRHRLSTTNKLQQQQQQHNPQQSSSTQQHNSNQQQQQQQPLTVQEYQQKLEQALYDAECNLEMERTNRSLQLLAATTSVTEASSKQHQQPLNTSASAAGIQFQKINVNNNNNSNNYNHNDNSNEFYGYNSDDNSLLLDESTIAERSSLVGGEDTTTTTTTDEEDDEDDDDDTASFVRGSTVGNSTVLSEFTRDTTTEYTRDTTTEYTGYSTAYNSQYTTETNETSTKKDSSHHHQTLLSPHSSYSQQQKQQLQKLNAIQNNGSSSSNSDRKKTRVRFDIPTKGEVKNDNNKDMTSSPWCMMYGNNTTKDDDTLTTYDGGATYNDDDDDDDYDDDTLAVMKRVVTCRPWGAEFVKGGGANGNGDGIVGEDDCETITTRDTRSIVSGSTYSRRQIRRGRGKDGDDNYDDTTTIYTGYTRDTKQRDDDAGTAKIIAGEKPYCQGFIGGGAGSEVRPPPPPPPTTLKSCTPKSSFPWMCTPGCMGGYVHEEKEIATPMIIRVGNSSHDISNARAASSVISATTRGTVNSNESNITQLTENIKKIMAASSARDTTMTAQQYNRDLLNSTLDEKLQAVKSRSGRDHANGTTRPEDQTRKDSSYFWKLDDSSSFLEKLKAADRSRSQDVARRMVPNANMDGKTTSSFWKGDGLWSSDQSTSFGDSTTNSTHLPKMNVMLREYDEARRRSLAFMQNDVVAPKSSCNMPNPDHHVAKMNAWMTVIDHSTGKPYWFNQVTRETSWKLPYDENDVSNHWKTAKDPSTGKTYYYNKMTQETCWKKPRGYKTEGGSDKNGRSVVANEMNRNETLLQQGTDLSRMRTQKQRGGGRVFMEENGIIIGSKTRPSHSASVRFAEAQSNDDVMLSRRKKEERDQYWISQSKKSIGKQPSGNHHQQQYRYNQQHHEEVGQEENSSRRRRLSLFYKKKSTKEKQPSSTTPSYSSPRPTLTSKSYNKTTAVDPESPDRTAETIPSRGSDGSEPCGIVVDGVTTFSI